MVNENTGITFNKKEKYVLIKMGGMISLEEVFNSIDQVVNHPEFVLGMARIWDFTFADIDHWSEDDTWMASNYSDGFPHGIKDVKVAFVSENKRNFNLLLGYKKHIAKVQTTVEVFDSMDNAMQWIAS